MKRVLLISDYFGSWPPWFQMFLASCARNPSVDWLIHTDCPLPASYPPNVTIVPITTVDYCQRASDILQVSFRPQAMYGICNLRPMFGVLNEERIKGYDFFGWSDLDVVFGDFRSIYDDATLEHNVVSASADICTGHLCLIRNEEWLVNAYQLLGNWRAILSRDHPYDWPTGLDEAGLSTIFSPSKRVRRQLSRKLLWRDVPARYWSNNHFVDQWATVFVPWPWHDGNRHHPEVWYWKDGKLWNDRDGDRQYLYLHLMNFKAARFIDKRIYGSAATWESLDSIMNFRWDEVGSRTVRIDRSGIRLVGDDE